MIITKDFASERKAVIALLNKEEVSIQRAFYLFVNKTISEDAMKAVRVALQVRDLDLATSIAVQHTLVLRDAIEGAFKRSASNEQKLLLRLIKDAPDIKAGIKAAAADMYKEGVALNFEVGDKAAAAMARRNAADSVREFSRRQRLSTRQAIEEGLLQGEGPVAVANRFKDSIGLTRNQVQAVKNYRALLEKGSAEAGDRALADQRFNVKHLTPAQIDRMVKQYQKNAIKARAETIARTEAQRAINLARDEREAALFAELEIENRIVRIWNSTHDHRVRDTHREMDQQERGEDEAFDSPSGAKLMFPGDPSAPLAEIINCRCVLTTRID